MDKDTIELLIEFNFWANARILAATELISIEEFRRSLHLDSGWGDLRSLLVHILDTEYGWRSILQSLSPDMILNPTDFVDVAALKARWKDERAAWLDYATRLNTTRLNQRIGDGTQAELNVWQTIIHVVTHGIQHRSEAAIMLTGYGHSPGDLDFDVFLLERAEHHAA